MQHGVDGTAPFLPPTFSSDESLLISRALTRQDPVRLCLKAGDISIETFPTSAFTRTRPEPDVSAESHGHRWSGGAWRSYGNEGHMDRTAVGWRSQTMRRAAYPVSPLPATWTAQQGARKCGRPAESVFPPKCICIIRHV